jgi:hypothetical protein
VRQEARIVSGLKRPAIGKPAARTGGSPDGAGGWALRAAALSGGAVARTRPVLSRVGAWAADRQVSPGTLHGISLLLALCAAIWFSGGKADRGAGLFALAGSVLAMAGAARLAAFLPTTAVRPRPSGRRRSADGSTDGLALPDVSWEDDQAGAVKAGRGDSQEPQDAKQGTDGRGSDDDADVVVVSRDVVTPDVQTAGADHVAQAESAGPASDPVFADRNVGGAEGDDGPGGANAGGEIRFGRWSSTTRARQLVARSAGEPKPAGGVRSYGWTAAVSSAAAESAIYGGLAAAGGPVRPFGMWPLAVLTIASVGTADLLGACRVAAVNAASAPAPGETPPDWSWPRRLPGLPRGARLVLAGLVLAMAGPQAGLFAVLGAELLALASTLVALGRIAPPAHAASGGSAAARARRRRAARSRGGGTAILAAMSPGMAPDAAGSGSETGTRTQVTAVVGVDGPAGTTAVRIITSARATKTTRGSAADADAPGPAVGDENGDASGREEASEGGPPPEIAGPADAGPAWPAGSAGEPDLPIAVGGVAGSARSAQAAAGAATPGAAGSGRAADSAGPGAATGDHTSWDRSGRPVGGSEAGGGTEARGGQAGGGQTGGADAQSGSSGGQASGTDTQASGTDGQASGTDGQYPAAAASPRPPGGVLALRDDGSAALWAGRLVQGNLIPLPPALAGLVATAMLAALGLRDLHGLVAMTPPIVMMLAAPGSSHPHDGRFDWLVPGLLLLAQYVYLGALGFAVGVPGPIVFAACALTGLWYVSLAARGQSADTVAAAAADTVGLTSARGAWTGAGWEVRLFLTGLAVTFGLGTFGYVGLAAYVGVLLVRQAANRHRYLTLVEDDRQ